MPGFIDPSIVTAMNVKQGPSTLIDVQQPIYISPPSSAPPTVTDALSVIAKGSTGGLSGIAAITSGKTNPTQALEGVAIKAAASVAGNYLQASIKSISSTFGGSNTSLATGISSALSGIFGNTNVPSASTTTTKISDPVSTNLLNTSKTPVSTPFVVNSLAAGSQTVGLSGSSSVFGSGAASMTGTSLSTLFNRLNIDSVSNLGTALTSSFSTSKVNGLFSALSASTGALVSSAVGGGVLGTTLGAVTKSVVAQSLGLPATPASTLRGSSALTTSTNNDLQRFLGSSNVLAQALGLPNLSSSFVTNPSTSLLTASGQSVNTNGSGVDSTTANAILALIRLAGCPTSTTNYSSANEFASLFKVALTAAATNGMSSEVNNLLGCTQASSAIGQQSLTSAFVASSGSQLSIATSIIGAISAPTTLNTPYVANSILSNPNLSLSDVYSVNNLFTTMGTSTTDAITVPGSATTAYPIYDASLLSQAQPSFVNGVFGDSTITDCFGGTEMGVQTDGSFGFI